MLLTYDDMNKNKETTSMHEVKLVEKLMQCQVCITDTTFEMYFCKISLQTCKQTRESSSTYLDG